MTLVRGLPLPIWARIFVHYYDNVRDDFLTHSRLRGALTPLIIARDLYPTALDALYDSPNVRFETIDQFNICLAPRARGKSHARAVRNIVICGSGPPGPAPGKKRSRKWGVGDVHRCLPRLFAKLRVKSLTLIVTMTNGADAAVVLAALRAIRVSSKARLQFRMLRSWDGKAVADIDGQLVHLNQQPPNYEMVDGTSKPITHTVIDYTTEAELESSRDSEERDFVLERMIMAIPIPKVYPLKNADTGPGLAWLFGTNLPSAIAHWKIDSLSLVAEDPLAARILRGSLWPALGINHIRVKTPKTIHPLDIFGDNSEVIIRAAMEGFVNESEISDGRRDNSGIIISPTTECFEIESEINDDRWADTSLPSAVSRITSGDWERVLPGIGQVCAEQEEEEEEIEYRCDDEYPSPVFSFVSDDSFEDLSSGQMSLSGGEGEGWDAAAAEEQMRKMAVSEKERE